MINVIAVTTPYNNYGEIDWKNFKLILNYFLFNKINYLIIFGTTGESYIFNDKNYFYISKFIYNYHFNCIFNCNILKLNKILKVLILLKINKVFGILISPQCYILPNNFNTFKYYKTLYKIGLNIFIYNIYKRTNFFFSIKLLKKINFILFLKNSNNNKNNLLLKKINKILFCGEDKNIFFCKKIKFIGTISIINNLFPKLFNFITKSNFKNLVKNIFLNKNPILIKYLLYKNSLINKNCLLYSLNYFYFTQSQI